MLCYWMKTQVSSLSWLFKRYYRYVWMGFAPWKCKMVLENWLGSKPKLAISGEQLDEVDRFRYLDNCILPGGGRSALAHTEGWIGIRWFVVSLVLAWHPVIDKSRICAAAVKSVLQCFYENCLWEEICGDFWCLNAVAFEEISVLLKPQSTSVFLWRRST